MEGVNEKCHRKLWPRHTEGGAGPPRCAQSCAGSRYAKWELRGTGIIEEVSKGAPLRKTRSCAGLFAGLDEEVSKGALLRKIGAARGRVFPHGHLWRRRGDGQGGGPNLSLFVVICRYFLMKNLLRSQRRVFPDGPAAQNQELRGAGVFPHGHLWEREVGHGLRARLTAPTRPANGALGALWRGPWRESYMDHEPSEVMEKRMKRGWFMGRMRRVRTRWVALGRVASLLFSKFFFLRTPQATTAQIRSRRAK
jgi:hypothetical protein